MNRDPTDKDIRNLCEAQVDFFKKHLRSSHNEWIIEDFDEWYDQLNTGLESDRLREIITKQKYQRWLAIANEYRIEIMTMIKEAKSDGTD